MLENCILFYKFCIRLVLGFIPHAYQTFFENKYILNEDILVSTQSVMHVILHNSKINADIAMKLSTSLYLSHKIVKMWCKSRPIRVQITMKSNLIFPFFVIFIKPMTTLAELLCNYGIAAVLWCQLISYKTMSVCSN